MVEKTHPRDSVVRQLVQRNRLQQVREPHASLEFNALCYLPLSLVSGP
jgi:hypothetical protein